MSLYRLVYRRPKTPRTGTRVPAIEQFALFGGIHALRHAQEVSALELPHPTARAHNPPPKNQPHIIMEPQPRGEVVDSLVAVPCERFRSLLVVNGRALAHAFPCASADALTGVGLVHPLYTEYFYRKVQIGAQN